jgi:hypothetical protein
MIGDNEKAELSLRLYLEKLPPIADALLLKCFV